MRKLEIPLCWFNRQSPTRDRAKWDGTHFVSTCRVCRTIIRRRSKGCGHKDWEPDHHGQPAWL